MDVNERCVGVMTPMVTKLNPIWGTRPKSRLNRRTQGGVSKLRQSVSFGFQRLDSERNTLTLTRQQRAAVRQRQHQLIQAGVGRLFRSFTRLPIKAIRSLWSAPFDQTTPLTAVWRGLKEMVYFPTLQYKRALVEVTGQRAFLNDLLPHRRWLTRHDPVGLKRYDAVVDKLLAQAQFYEPTDSKALLKQVRQLYKTKAYFRDRRVAVPHWKWIRRQKKEYWFRPPYTVAHERLKSLAHNHRKRVDSQALSAVFATVPLSKDKATQLYLAGSITELFYNRPDWVAAVLNRSNPLRILLTPSAKPGAKGFYMPGLNIIAINTGQLWTPIHGSSTPQHEFVHALCDQQLSASPHRPLPLGLMNDRLPGMTGDQKTRFMLARHGLRNQFNHDSNQPWAKLRYWLTGAQTTGIRHYGFYNPAEFLTVTLDAFNHNPKGLRKTDAGRQLYQVYRELFKLDPLQVHRPSP